MPWGRDQLRDMQRETLAERVRQGNREEPNRKESEMKVSEMYPSRWLAAADLKGQRLDVVVDRIEMEDLGEGTSKPVLYFRGKKKGLVLNKTNSIAIASVLGDDTTAWAGHTVTLFAQMVTFKGQTVPAIRLIAAAPSRQAGEDNDDLPF